MTERVHSEKSILDSAYNSTAYNLVNNRLSEVPVLVAELIQCMGISILINLRSGCIFVSL